MLIHDNEDDDNRIIIFGTPGCIDSLQRSRSWGIDGTFSSCPQLFSQLITIHAEFNSSDPNDSNIWAFPCLWVLLTSKDQPTYESMLSIISMLGTFSPDYIMVDFELALRNALAKSFPGAEIAGCYFHFCQALVRHVNTLGLKNQYQRVTVCRNGIRSYSQTRIWIRRLMSLAFVPTNDIITAFHSILDEIPDDLDIDHFLEYFQSTWVEGRTARRNGRARYPPVTWNIRGRTLLSLNRTNNHLEAFHNAFKQMVGHANPTVWAFIAGMRLQQAISDDTMTAIAVEEGQATQRYSPVR